MSMPLVPISGVEANSWFYILSRAINALIQGRGNNVGTFTITAAAASTTVTNNLFQSDQVPVFVPTTANAAAAIGTTYVSARANGSFTVTHANNAQVDRTFLYAFHG